MKKKPHQKQSEIKSLFSEYRRNHVPLNKYSAFDDYEIKKVNNGYQLNIHREREADETHLFESKTQLDNYLKTIANNS